MQAINIVLFYKKYDDRILVNINTQSLYFYNNQNTSKFFKFVIAIYIAYAN